MTRRIKHAKTATVVPSVAFTDWNAWLVDEADQVIDLNSLSGPMVFNEAGADVDFRVESDTNPNAFLLNGAKGNIGLGLDVTPTDYDPWGVVQFWQTGSPQSGYNSGGWYGTVLFNPTTDVNNDGYAFKGVCVVQNGVPAGGYPTSDITGVYGCGKNYGSNSELDKIFGGSFEAWVQGKAVTDAYGIMVQTRNESYQSATVGTMHGIYADAYTTDPSGGKTLTINTAYGAELRTFCKTNYATSVSHIGTIYGLYSSVYSQQAPSSTATVDYAYNIYIAPYRPGGIGGSTYGLIGSYYSLFLGSLSVMNATNKWQLYVEDGVSFFGGKIGIGTDAPATSAVLELYTTTGALLLSRMTTTEKNALTAVNGMVVYDTTLGKFQGYQAGAWTSFA